MKNSPLLPRRRGFTLVELLVVIAIIATLASLGFVVGNKAIKQARKLQSKTDLINICGAVEGYRADNNGIYPDVTSNGAGLEVDTDDTHLILDGTADAERLIRALCAEETESDKLNRRETVYLAKKQAKASGKDGIDLAGTYSYKDYWGNPFHVIIDTNYDDELTNPLDRGDDVPIRKGVIGIGQGTSMSLELPIETAELKDIVTSWD